MFESFLLKYISADGKIRHTPVDEDNDVFRLAGIQLGGTFIFDESNIVTVSGVNSVTDYVTSTSADLTALILSVSGASSHRDDLQDLLMISVSGALNSKIVAVSGASSARDDTQDALLISVSGALNSKILSVSGASSLRDDSQDTTLISVSANLQSQLNAITNDIAREERFAASGGQTVFTVTTIAFDPSVSVKDLQVYKNGQKRSQALSLGLYADVVSGGDFVKTSTTTIQFVNPCLDGDLVVIREERTGGGGGGGGGSTDLENILVNPQPIVNGLYALGTNAKAWNALYLKDTLNSNVYEIQIVSGVLQATLV